MITAVPGREEASSGRKTGVLAKMMKWSTPIALVATFVVFALLCPYFATISNILDILNQSVVLGILGIAFMLPSVVGAMDVSVGVSCSLAGVAACMVFQRSCSTVAGIGAALLVGLAIGIVNAFLCGVIGTQPFLATLSTTFIFQGVELMVTKASALYPSMPASYVYLGQGSIGQIPVAVVVLALCALGVQYLLRLTRLGRHFYATGASKEAARACGIEVDRIIITAFIMSGLLAALSGIMLSARLGSAQTMAGDGYLLYAIGSVFLGTTMFGRGEPNVWGTVVGSVFITLVENGLTMLGVWWYWQYVITGILLIVSVMISSVRRAHHA